MKYVPRPVSRRYRLDWQYAADVNKIPFVREAALLISIAPFVGFLFPSSFPQLLEARDSSLVLWMLWGAALAFILARLLYYFTCPKFIREYHDFGQYDARQHSHRWIVWEFYHNLESLSGWRQIVKETSSKGLAVELKQLSGDLPERLGATFVDGSGDDP